MPVFEPPVLPFSSRRRTTLPSRCLIEINRGRVHPKLMRSGAVKCFRFWSLSTPTSCEPCLDSGPAIGWPIEFCGIGEADATSSCDGAMGAPAACSLMASSRLKFAGVFPAHRSAKLNSPLSLVLSVVSGPAARASDDPTIAIEPATRLHACGVTRPPRL
jgi:hypothetical protein